MTLNEFKQNAQCPRCKKGTMYLLWGKDGKVVRDGSMPKEPLKEGQYVWVCSSCGSVAHKIKDNERVIEAINTGKLVATCRRIET